MALVSRFGASAGLLAALSMVSMPASAAEMPLGMIVAAPGSAVFADFNSTSIDSESDIAEWRGRGRGWRGGWRRHRRVDAGDVIAGVLILGGIAAIADAASDSRRRDREGERRRYERRDYRPQRRDNGTRGLDRAVDQCVGEIQRDVRVDRVDSVDRTANGWIVTGSLFNGSGFTCAIGNNGRIDAIEYGDFKGAGNDRGGYSADGQFDDDTYYAARQSSRGVPPTYRTRTYEATGNADEPFAQVDGDLRPAYPGGPLPGEPAPN